MNGRRVGSFRTSRREENQKMKQKRIECSEYRGWNGTVGTRTWHGSETNQAQRLKVESEMGLQQDMRDLDQDSGTWPYSSPGGERTMQPPSNGLEWFQEAQGSRWRRLGSFAGSGAQGN